MRIYPPFLVSIAAVCLLSCREASVETSSDKAEFEIATDSDTLVLSFRYLGGQIDTEGAPPLLRIYGDGRVLVHRVTGSRAPGDYALQLTHDELMGLLGSLADKGVFTVTTDDLRSESTDSPPQATAAISDATTTEITVHLKRFSPPGQPAVSPFDYTFRWYALQQSAQHRPDSQILRDLAAAERELLQLTQRDDLEKL